MKRNLRLIAAVCVCLTNQVYAQWQFSGIAGTEIYSLAAGGTDTVYAGCVGTVSRTFNGGGAWAAATTGFPAGMGANSVAIAGGNVYAIAADGSGVHKNAVAANAWTSTGTGPDAFHLIIRGASIYGVGANGVYSSPLSAISWQLMNTGLPHTCIFSFGGAGDAILAYISDEGGSCSMVPGVGTYRRLTTGSWTLTDLPAGFPTPFEYPMAGVGTRLFAGALSSIYMSNDTGATWTSTSTGLPGAGNNISALAVSGNTIFAGLFGRGVYMSGSNGNNWTRVNTGLVDSTITALVVSGAYLYAGTISNGVWKRPLSEIITSVAGAEKDSYFEVYPNPSAGSFMLSLKTQGEEHIKINVINALGETVYASDEAYINGSYHAEIKLPHAAKGIYAVQVHARTKTEVRKIVIE